MPIKCPSSPLLINFGWKSIFLITKISTEACFLEPFVWKIFLKPFTLRQKLSLLLRYVSAMQQRNGFCFHIHSVTLCPFIRELSSLILTGINDQWVLILFILLLVVVMWMCVSLCMLLWMASGSAGDCCTCLLLDFWFCVWPLIGPGVLWGSGSWLGFWWARRILSGFQGVDLVPGVQDAGLTSDGM